MQYIFYSKSEHIATITLNRPEVLNAMNVEMTAELASALAQAEADRDVRVAVINSSIQKSFTAGGDIKYESQLTETTAVDFAENGKSVMDAIESCRVPVILSVDGYNLGGGIEMAAAADLVITSDKAKFGIPTINLGTVPAWGATVRLTRALGRARAFDILATGRMFSAQEAYDMGLAQYIVPRDELAEKTLELAKTIADKAPGAMQRLKSAILYSLNSDQKDSMKYETSLYADCCNLEDRAEAMSAFLEKREHKPYTDR